MEEKKSSLPKGISNAFIFTMLEYMTLSVMTGVPMIIYLKGLGATATILSLSNAFVYFLDILQLPAASFVNRIGFRRFAANGFLFRSTFVFFTALIAFLPMGNTLRISLLLCALFAFNIVRGISLCGILPWMSHIVPKSLRGKYTSLDQLFFRIAVVLTTLGLAFYLEHFSIVSHMGPIFLLIFCVTILSVVFLKRVPDPVRQLHPEKDFSFNWGEIFRNKIFLNFFIFNFLIYAVDASGTVFWIPFLKDTYQAPDTLFLFITVFQCVISMVIAFISSQILDHVGSRAMLKLSNLFLFIHFAAWAAVAGGILGFSWPFVLFQSVTAGIAFPLFYAANTRMAMNISSERERTHFFAAFNVNKSVALGLTPIFWGIFIDHMIHQRVISWHHWNWHAYSFLYFGISVLLLISMIFLIYKIPER